MTDVHDQETRSFNMSRIRSKDTKPEMIVRKFLFSQGFRYRIHVKHLPGKPDIVLPKYRTVVFVHGCFWHGHKGCFRIPKTRTNYWLEKIGKNRKRDAEHSSQLRKKHWHVISIFECELHKSVRQESLNYLSKTIKGLL